MDKRRKSKLSPEENARRMTLYYQGYSNMQMAKILGLNYKTIKGWLLTRGLKANIKDANPRNCRRGTDEFDFTPGETIKLGTVYGQGIAKKVKWRWGKVLEVYPRFAVIQLPNYRVTVSQWELKDGKYLIERRRAG